VPIKMSIRNDLLIQRVNREDGIMVEGKITFVQHILLYLILMQVESLTEICKSINNKDLDDSEFPPVLEIGPHY
jgi:hypothetical protein